jgi:hypothetical protein
MKNNMKYQIWSMCCGADMGIYNDQYPDDKIKEGRCPDCKEMTGVEYESEEEEEK